MSTAVPATGEATAAPAPAAAAAAAPWVGLLPEELLALPLERLALSRTVTTELAASAVLTVGDVFAMAAAPRAANGADGGGALAPARADAIAAALARALHDGLAQFSLAAMDWPTLRAQLLGPLGDEERVWLEQLVGFEHEPPSGPALARKLGITTGELDDRAEQLRRALGTRAADLLARCHRETGTDLVAFDGVLLVEHAAPGTVVKVTAQSAPDRELGLRLLAFLFPREVTCHRGALFAMSPRRFRRLLRTLPSLLPPHRLPLPVDAILAELASLDHHVPRGVLVHVLRTELHVAIELDPQLGEVAAADPRTPAARLVEVLQEARRPLPLADLVFAYRERFRRGSTATIARALRGDEFVRLGADCWALRADHEKELAAIAPLADKVARRLCAEGGRHHVADLLADDERDERTVHYVLDRLAHDPRVRLLGRGDACAASHRRSQVLERLLQSFRKAAGDVVLGKFLDNQPEPHARLVERLLRHNRLFVMPAEDRIDTLSNWPFNDERLRRLIALVQDQLRRRTGYVHAAALKAAVDKTDLGGDWLTPTLLADVLRRHGPFEVMPGGIVARADVQLVRNVRRSLRQALRDARQALTAGEVLQARPDLGEFAACIGELLASDPLVHSPDGVYFMLT
jgi:hypothetical protein